LTPMPGPRPRKCQMASVAASKWPSLAGRLADAWHEAGNFAANMLVAATRQGDDERADFWAAEMARCDDQSDLILALITKGWL
jgi:hypothetical protein